MPVNDSGYEVIYVGKAHHLANSQGWAKAHRIEAEKKLGRKLLPGECVHHIDGDKLNNSHDNLHVFASNAEHVHAHAADPSAWRAPGEPNPIIDCACGCGEKLYKYRPEDGRRRSHIHGHHLRGKKRHGLRGKIRKA